MASGTARRGRLWAASAALTVLALLAGFAYYKVLLRPDNAGNRVSAALPRPAVRPPRTFPDPSAVNGPVASLLSVAKPEPGGRARAGVSLRAPAYHDSEAGQTDESILAHEIVRQAVLIAARDAGAVVRDAVVGDAVPEPDAPADLEVGSLIPPGGIPVVILATRSADGRKVVATYDVGKGTGRFVDYSSLVERVEALSRSPDGFPKQLGPLGVNGAAAVSKADGPPGEDFERRLSELTFTEQFAAVRGLHAEVRDRGESPGRLGALARGYANLGVLTEFHWGSRQKALKARALLLAQRLVALDPRSPHALWHRAYVRALVGFHKDALDDLAAAETLAKGAGVAAPRWAPLVDALCRFQTDKLVAARSGPDGQLAMLMAFLTYEESKSGVLRVVSLGQDVLGGNPECYRVHDTLCRVGGVGSWHAATLAGLRVMDRALPARLKALPGLPEQAGKLLEDAGPEAAVVKALGAAGRDGTDAGEPSWAALGGMVADTRFALVYRRGDFMRSSWGVPADAFLDEVWPTVADHRDRAALEAFRLDPRRDYGKFSDLLSGVNIPDIGFNEYAFIYQVGTADIKRHRHLVTMMLCHGDVVYHDFAELLSRVKPEVMAAAAKDLEPVSPFAPLWKAKLVAHDWAYAEPHAREWEEGAGGHPDVLTALGTRYVGLQRWDDAERCLKKAAELSPDTSKYRALAEVYKGRGDLERWEDALDKALTKDDPGLSHMRVEIEFADHYASLGKWDKAMPHAENAAATGASAGMLCASRCYEAKGDWEQAEVWQKQNSERYPEGAWLGWFNFCKRTGHGDVAAARKFAQDYVDSLSDRPSDQVTERVGFFRLVDGKPREAVEIFQRLYEKTRFPYAAIMAVALYDDLGETAKRDSALDELAGLPMTKTEKLDGLVKVLRDGLSAGDGRIDSKALVAALNTDVTETRRLAVGLFMARLLYSHGDPEKAKDILGKCAKWMETNGWGQTLATLWLREWEARPQEKVPAK